MNDSIDNSFGDGLNGQLVVDINLCRLCAFANSGVDATQNEIDSLVDHLENIAVVNLLRKDWLFDPCAVKLGAFDGGRGKPFLRIVGKEQERCVELRRHCHR